MVLMERIVRPHLPVPPDPTQQKPQCQQAPASTTVKMPAPSILAQTAAAQNQTNPMPKAPGAVERTRTSTWAYSYKKYMTKKEKEKAISDTGGKQAVIGQYGTTQPGMAGTDPLGPKKP
jgi:hypothetical protein